MCVRAPDRPRDMFVPRAAARGEGGGREGRTHFSSVGSTGDELARKCRAVPAMPRHFLRALSPPPLDRPHGDARRKRPEKRGKEAGVVLAPSLLAHNLSLAAGLARRHRRIPLARGGGGKRQWAATGGRSPGSRDAFEREPPRPWARSAPPPQAAAAAVLNGGSGVGLARVQRGPTQPSRAAGLRGARRGQSPCPQGDGP